MPLSYTFRLDTRYAGRALHVYNTATGAEVSGSPFTLDAYGDCSASLPEGSYTGKVSNPEVFAGDGFSVVDGVLDIPGSIAASGGGGGTADTAKFIGTATGDTSGDQFELTFVADGTLPDGYDIDGDGRITIDGPAAIHMDYRFRAKMDMTDATGFSTATLAPESDATILVARRAGDSFSVNAGGPLGAAHVGDAGVVFEFDAVEEGITQSHRVSVNNGEVMTIKATINGLAYDDAGDPVVDGVLTGALAIWITQNTLPDLPALPA